MTVAGSEPNRPKPRDAKPSRLDQRCTATYYRALMNICMPEVLQHEGVFALGIKPLESRSREMPS